LAAWLTKADLPVATVHVSGAQQPAGVKRVTTGFPAQILLAGLNHVVIPGSAAQTGEQQFTVCLSPHKGRQIG
jgi:hypothetical protein